MTCFLGRSKLCSTNGYKTGVVSAFRKRFYCTQLLLSLGIFRSKANTFFSLFFGEDGGGGGVTVSGSNSTLGNDFFCSTVSGFCLDLSLHQLPRSQCRERGLPLSPSFVFFSGLYALTLKLM